MNFRLMMVIALAVLPLLLLLRTTNQPGTAASRALAAGTADG
jgi:hypothetical protein